MKRFFLVAILFAPVLVAAHERDRCPFSTIQQVTARDAVDSKMGQAIDSLTVAAGKAKQPDIEKARKALNDVESWAMGLTDEQLKTDYLCAVMLRRRGLDDAALEFVDSHARKNQDAAEAKKAIQTPPCSVCSSSE